MWRIVDKTAEALAALCLIASVLMIFANVLHRYVVLGWVSAWAERASWVSPVSGFLEKIFLPISAVSGEVPGYFLVWISFFGAYIVQRQNGHICFGMLIDTLQPGVQKALRAASDGLLLALFSLLFVQSVRMILVDGSTEIESAEIAQGWFMSVLPVAAFLLAASVVKAMLWKDR